MEEKLKGIVLFCVNYGESDRILTIFTLEKGVVSAKIKGVKKAGAKLKFASEPFCFAEFLFSTSSNKRIVTGASLIDSFYPLREDIVKYYAGATVLEFNRKFLQENIISSSAFLLTVETLKDLAYSKKQPEQVLAGYLISSLSLAGYALDLQGCHNCGSALSGSVTFDYETGGFYDSECRKENFREINYATYLALKNIANGEDASEDGGVKALRLLDYYITNKTEEKLSSLKEMNKILN